MAWPSKKKFDPLAEIEAEISGLIERKNVLETRLAEARIALQAAHDARRQALLNADLSDADAVAGYDRACRDADDRVTGLEDALLGLNSKLGDAEQKLAAECDRVTRAGAKEFVDLNDALESAAGTCAEVGKRLHRALELVLARIPGPAAVNLVQLDALERNIASAVAEVLATARSHAVRVTDGTAPICRPAPP